MQGISESSTFIQSLRVPISEISKRRNEADGYRADLAVKAQYLLRALKRLI